MFRLCRFLTMIFPSHSVAFIWLQTILSIYWMTLINTGPSCSKLMTSLVNDHLKFISSDMQICWNFLLKNVSSFCRAKATHIFSAKKISILYIESAKTVNEMTLNELVKLTMLWTSGPRIWQFWDNFLQFPIKWYLVGTCYTHTTEAILMSKHNILSTKRLNKLTTRLL